MTSRVCAALFNLLPLDHMLVFLCVLFSDVFVSSLPSTISVRTVIFARWFPWFVLFSDVSSVQNLKNLYKA